MTGTHDATFYVQLEPDIVANSYAAPWVKAIKAVGLTLKRPGRPRGRVGTVTVKLTVRVPDAAFLPLAPEAVIVVPVDMTELNPVEVEASAPADGDQEGTE